MPEREDGEAWLEVVGENCFGQFCRWGGFVSGRETVSFDIGEAVGFCFGLDVLSHLLRYEEMIAFVVYLRSFLSMKRLYVNCPGFRIAAVAGLSMYRPKWSSGEQLLPTAAMLLSQ